MKKLEIILIVLFLLSLILNIFLLPGGGVLVVLSLSTLAIIYFYLGFALFNNIPLRKIFKKVSYQGLSIIKIIGAVITGIALSITLIGLMFKLMSWPESDEKLTIGVSLVLLVVIVVCFKYMTNKSVYYITILRRGMIFGGLALVFLFLPQPSLVSFKYRNYPAYVKAYKEAYENPESKVLKENADRELSRIHVK